MNHAPQGFLRTHVFSTDHKVIAKQYMFTGLVMAVLGGLLAYGMRLQLAWPGDPLPLVGAISPHEYNAYVTMHGSIMIFWVAMPLLVAGFGNLLIPLMIGTDDMAFPTLNMMSFWIFFLSTVVLIASFFVPGGAAAGGWTSYPPLAADAIFSGVDWGVNLWILAVALELVAFLMGGINFITTSINLRAEGMRIWDWPFVVWQIVIASIVFMISVGPLIGGAVMLLLDRTIGTGFYANSLGGDPLLFQHLFWFFGHPEVYVLLLPALGIMGEVLCANSRKALFAQRHVVWSTIVAGILSFVVWAHHQFISGIDPRLAAPFSLTTILISVPFAVAMFAFVATLWKGSIRFTTAMQFALGFIGLFFIGGVTGIMNGSAAADIYIHDSYFVVAHFHYTLVPITLFGTFAGIYHWYPKMFGRKLDERLGTIHFLGTFLSFNAIFIPLFQLGLLGHHRRIAVPTSFDFLQGHAESLQAIATVATAAMLIFQVPFVINIFLSLKKGEVAGKNPWNATTMEWNTASPPPHGNFTERPVSYRGPYFYSPPGDGPDFLPVWKSDETADAPLDALKTHQQAGK